MTRSFSLVSLILYLITSGCAPTVIQSVPSNLKVSKASKQVPQRDKIHPTQRPYHVMGRTYYPVPSSFGYKKTGIASWYGKKFHGKKTSNGETYNMYGTTAAHKTLPMNTFLLVKNLENGLETIVRVNDRGPFVKGRIIDLSYTSAKEIAMDKRGTARVTVTALGEAVKTNRGGKTIERFLPYDFEHGEFYVQIGAFTEKKNAARLKDKMLNRGRKAISQKYSIDGKHYFRVQVRAGKDIDSARRLEQTLEKEYPGAFVIAR